MTKPHEPVSGSLLKTVTAVTGIIPIMVDFILFLRILVVYPYNATLKVKFFVIISIPILMMLARLINYTCFIVNISITVDNGILIVGEAFHRLIYPEIEWFLGFFDNL